MNRLSSSSSPYLLQHADNPVDWWPWSEEAFAEAQRRNVPVFLSIGYAACHWCHVMAHESFEDPATAEVLNSAFVAVKVDREERPDIDAVYMQATQALTGHGGWPMSVFLTPDRRPFYAGTYFPPTPHHGLPSFTQVVLAIGEAWTQRNSEVRGSADTIVEHLGGMQLKMAAGTVSHDDLAEARDELKRTFDSVRGGFGGAPKFPPSMVCEGLLRLGDADSMRMVGHTLEAMARGGIYDQLAGGFARYSVDAGWVVPHFEKMLYDNALLLGVYTHWWRRTGEPMAARVVGQTIDWLVAEMRTKEGAFAASLDADSLDETGHLHEGAFYAWNPEQLAATLGEEDGAWAARTLRVTAEGTFEHGLSTLQLPVDPDPERWTDVRSRLAQARARRSRPGRDDKVVAAWNGWLIDSLVQAAFAFDRSDWLELAAGAGAAVWDAQWTGQRLRRTSRQGRASEAPGVLEDYGALTQAFTRLAAATADPIWIDRAYLLAEVLMDQFDDGNDGFFDTAADAEQLFTRPRDATDNATPSGLSAAVHGLALLGEFTGNHRYAHRAESAASNGAELVRKAPRFAGWLLADAVSRSPGREPVQVAVVGQPGSGELAELVRTAHIEAPAGSVIVAGAPDTPGVPLLADRPLRDGVATAYVCRGFLCRLPVTSTEDLRAELAAAAGQPAR
ncbi:MAG TPA: thioredoxin domain-containing protein [Propionibacteriaceae bacterium]|nr:thioredoxin domain-containing protein [Propionibacteriaceae bacterium]